MWKENQTGLITHQLSHEPTPILSFDKVRLILIFLNVDNSIIIMLTLSAFSVFVQ